MITFAVIGSGWITDSWIECAQATKQWKLAAVYSRSEETARKFASKYSVSSTHTSIDSLVSDSGLDAIYIASPNSLHYEQAKQALSAKKHVIVEKPATSTVAELDELFKLAAEKGVFLIEAYRHVQECNFHVAKRALHDEKRIGPIYGASLTYASYSSRYNNVLNGETPNIFSLDFSGGALVDLGVYPVSFAVALFGRPKGQTYSPYICRTGADAGGFITLSYEGFAVQINQSKCYTSTAPSEVYGEKGTLTLNGVTDIASVTVWSPKTKQTEELAGPKVEKNMQEEAEEFARIIQEGDKAAAAKLQKLSEDVIHVTTGLRRHAGIVFPADRT